VKELYASLSFIPNNTEEEVVDLIMDKLTKEETTLFIKLHFLSDYVKTEPWKESMKKLF
jgi:phosphopantothenoylcysteine synthetase/decarboxylase